MGLERSVNTGLAPGTPKNELPTPCLLLDLDKFESNLRKMAAHVSASGINLRPHAKSHKCAEIAKRQIAAGAVGVCAATITEAECMVEAGIGGLLITSEMAGADKTHRLVHLSRKAPDTMSVVDSPAHAEQLNQAATAEGIVLNVLIDLDLGLHRTGAAGVQSALSLAETILKLDSLNLKGVNAYSSISAHVVGLKERREHSLKSMGPAVELLSKMRAAGMPAEILSGGSTGTFNIDTEIREMTELQAGSYIFMDVDYMIIGGQSGPVYDDFQSSLTVLSTIISNNYKGLATVDAGFKAFATDRPFGPRLCGSSDAKYHFAGDEHGMVELPDSGARFSLGSKLEFIVPHCDPSVNLYDQIYCIRGEKVEDVWRIDRGYRSGPRSVASAVL
ncbi:MAG TPA: DSD1 family PLP-dependent enzyme [Blastocatellia bacterium]